jgi:NADPH-dependent glutamate synthase beta subunit-like oxidoreductase
VDDPVAIKELKRFVSDRIQDPGYPPQWKGPRKGRVAIIGSGPAGLTAAYFLATMGREVKVFEALDVVGGLLAVGIPQYRLPGDVLERDIEYIRRAGVEIVTGSKVSSVKQLRDDGYDAVFVATGAHKSTSLGIPGEEMDGVVDALRFLREALRGDVSKIEGRVVVIGGGNAAIDAARTALRLGASSVTILYRRTREEMPAIASEIEDALSEGVELRELVAPIAINGDEHVRRVCCQEMVLGEADDNGRRRPVPLPDSNIEIEADFVISAVGQTPDLDFAQEDGSLIVSRGRIETEVMTQKSGEDGVFAGGDAVTGPATIIDAIAAGQRAARAIDIYLGGKGELLPDTLIAPQIKPDEEMADKPRQRVCHLSQSARIGSFAEVVEGFTEENACIEACRCLRCDLEHNIDD